MAKLILSAEAKRTYSTLKTSMLKQMMYGNLTKEGQWLLNTKKGHEYLKTLVAQSYAEDPEKKFRTRELTSKYTRTGSLARTYESKATGKVVLTYGRELQKTYKESLLAHPNTNKTSITVQQIVGRDERGRVKFKEVKYTFDLTSKANFVRSLKGKAALIAARINNGEDRIEVLHDYNY